MLRGFFICAVSMAAASGRQHGSVEKSLHTKQWYARFQFNRGGERTSTYGPPRASRDVAQQDRERIAATMLLQPASSRMQAAEAAIECLRGGQLPILQDGPVPASTTLNIGADDVASMGYAQLCKLANQTPGITRHKKIKRGSGAQRPAQNSRKNFFLC